MPRDVLSRRDLVRVTAGAATGAIAGCTASDDSDDDPDPDQDLDPSDWEDVAEIRLEGHTNGWLGAAPSLIEGVRNPTLILFEGDEYELTWENRDGLRHNLEFRTESDGAIDGARTGYLSGRGETATLAFEAASSMHQYVCAPHARSMTGYVRVVDE